MRCSICLGPNRELARACGSCGARLDEARHRELWGVAYLLGQVGKWDEEHRLEPGLLASLRDDYGRRRDALKAELLPPSKAVGVAALAGGVAAAIPSERKAEEVRKALDPVPAPGAIPAGPRRSVAPVRPEPRPAPPAAPPRPPFSWKNLHTGKDIDLAIWGMILLALIVGVAGRIRKIPAMPYLSAAHLLAAYYLALHKHEIGTLEFYTVPIGAGAVLWSVLALREKGLRGLIEGLAVAVLFLPSAVQSFVPERNVHTLAALGLAFAAILAGMGLKRRVLVLGGTGAFVLEGLGKAVHFLIERQLSAAEWGMIVGGLLILTAAAFEARKAKLLKEPLEALRSRAGKVLAALK